MSITFGIYDFFSYTVPGVLYILVANHLLFMLRMPSIDLNSLNTNIGGVLLWAMAAYVVGQLMDSFAVRWYYRVNKFHAETRALHDFREKHTDIKTDFTIHDRQSLFSVIRHHDLELARYIDTFKAISIMLNNISLALLLFAVVQVFALVMDGFSLRTLFLIVVSLIFSYVAIARSAVFNEWHWEAVYQHARQYGKSVAEMFKGTGK